MVTKSWMHPVWIDQWTPLHLAAYTGHFSVCKLIINNVVEKNPGDQTGWTPLHSAAQNGHLKICKLILNNINASYVCNRYIKDKFGNTPLKLATQYQNEDIRTAILKFLSDTKIRNSTYLKDHQNKNRVGKEEDEDKDLDVQFSSISNILMRTPRKIKTSKFRRLSKRTRRALLQGNPCPKAKHVQGRKGPCQKRFHAKKIPFALEN